MKDNQLIIAGLIFVVIVCVTIIVLSVENNGNRFVHGHEIIEVEGMTCIEYNGSLTCNWNEWAANE